MTDKLPDKVKRIDVLRVEYKHKKLCQCVRTPSYEIDVVNRLVYCQVCGAIVDPFEALKRVASHYGGLGDQVEQLLNQAREIDSYKPHLRVIKKLEKSYRGDMVPCCPKCEQPFDLAEITAWRNRRFIQP